MQKRAQLTFFLIISLFLLAGIILYLYISANTTQPEKDIAGSSESEFINAENFIELCVGQLAESAVKRIGDSGGRIEPKEYLDYFSAKINYAYNKGDYDFPSRSEMETDIKGYIRDNMNSCINITGLKVEYSSADIEVNIINKSVLIIIDPRISLIKSDSRKIIAAFPININVRLGYIHDVADEIAKDMAYYKDSTELSRLSNNEFNISVIQYDYKNLIFDIVDEKSRLGNNEYEFEFAALFDTLQLLNKTPHVPFFTNLKDFNISAGEEFYYKVEAGDYSGDTVQFFSITSLFEIGANGVIEFTPKEKDKGMHTIAIEVYDSNGNSNEGIMHISVI